MAKMELEIGTCPTGILLALKSVDGRIHNVTAIEMTNEEALEISKLIKEKVKEKVIFKAEVCVTCTSNSGKVQKLPEKIKILMT